MAALTLEEIEKQIRFRGDYQNLKKFPRDDVRKLIQQAFKKFWQIVAKAHTGYWDTETTFPTVANQAFVALPSDVWSLLALDRLESNEYVTMHQVPLSERNRYGSSTGKPLAYRTSARGLELYPTPDTVYTLRVTYTPKAPDLAVSQPREYYNGWEEYIIESVLLVLDGREKLPLDARKAAIKDIVDMVIDGANEHRAQEPEYLNLRELGDFDPFRDGVL